MGNINKVNIPRTENLNLTDRITDSTMDNHSSINHSSTTANNNTTVNNNITDNNPTLDNNSMANNLILVNNSTQEINISQANSTKDRPPLNIISTTNHLLANTMGTCKLPHLTNKVNIVKEVCS